MKTKIQRESDGAFVMNPAATVILPETKDKKGFEFSKKLCAGILSRLNALYPKEKFNLIDVEDKKPKK